MASNDTSANQQFPSESCRSSKSSSETRKSESEAQEVKNTRAGRYEKTSRESETFEARSRSSETFETGTLPPDGHGADGGNRGGGTGSGGNDSGGGNGTDGGGADWHDRVPQQIRLSVEGVQRAGWSDAPLLSGDYILDLEHRSASQCLWTVSFPQRCGLSGMTLSATPAADGQLELRAFFTGSVAGPTWAARAPRIESLLLAFDRGTAANPSAGCLWPESILLMPLGDQAAQGRFYISPEPTAAQWAMMAASGGSSSSCSCSSSGECPPCPPPEPPCDAEEECCPEEGDGGTGGGCSGPSCPATGPAGPSPNISSEPVRYANGELQLSVNDVSSSGFGRSWRHQRVYSNQMSHNYDFGNGFNWLVRQWGYLLQSPSGVITVVFGPGRNLWFDPDGAGGYAARYGAKSTLKHDAASGLFRLARPSGEEYAFHDFDQITFPPGLFARHRSAGGQVTEAAAYTLDDRIAEIQRSLTSGGSTTTESFRYEYFDSGEQAGRLQHVTLRRQVDGSGWQNIQRTAYDYYGLGQTHGSLGDLMRAVQQEFDGNAWQDKDVHYYRYWKGGDTKGFAHGLKYVLEPESYAQLSAVADPLAAGDAQVAQYADYYYEYDSQRRVVKETVQAGALTYSFAYTASAHSNGYNRWSRKTVETRPDGAEHIVYTNYIGQVLVKELKPGMDRWIEYRKYDFEGRLIEHAQPSAVLGYDDSSANLNVSLKSDDGLIRLTEYYNTTGSGGVAGYKKADKLKQGSDGTSVVLRQYEYASHSANGTTVHPLSKQIEYRNEDGSGAIETSYSYSFHSGTLQIEELTTTLPAVPSEQNGSGTSDTRRERFDTRGYLTWRMDERGFITRQKHDGVTGALTQRIEDVDTSQTTDAPSGWSTPSGGGLHLVSDYEHDDYEHDERGRMTQELGPQHTGNINGTATSVRRATWHVHRDPEHEQRMAQGYYEVSTGTNTLINPVSITKRDRKGHVRQQIQAVRASTFGRLSESDNFAQSDYVRWTTRQYSDCCTLIAERIYHTIPGSGEGSAGMHFSETQFGYDSMKRRNRVVSPGGTIRFDVFDVRGQVIAHYVGTDDSGASESDPTGGGAVGNNMVLLRESEYDSGSDGGDGNLTRQTQHVDAATTRVTQYLYDWRNRQQAVDGELDYYRVDKHDHLGHLIQSDRRDTSLSGNLISREKTQYDDRGRVYRRIRYAVDPATGTVAGYQPHDLFYDEAGNLVRQEPAGSMEYQIFSVDSLGRRVSDADPLNHSRSYTFDAASNRIATTDQVGKMWTIAYDPVGRKVRWSNPLGESTSYGYDAAGKRHMVTDGVGHITTASFDAAGRIVTVTDPLGKVASYTYDADGNQTSVTDPNGNTTTSDYDYLARRISVTDPAGHEVQFRYNLVGELTMQTDAKGHDAVHVRDKMGRETSVTDRLGHTTWFTYTALGQLETLTDAENQKTRYEYDGYGRQAKVIWPDHVLGSDPGDVGYGITQAEYDSLDRVLRTTDQLGDTVTFTYDAAGRLLSRDYRTRASSPAGAISDRDTFTYDAASRMLNATSGRYGNDVARGYDDAGRKTSESLIFNGQTYTTSTQYDAAGRVWRLIYPNGSEAARTYTARGQLHTIAIDLTVIDTRLYADGGRMTSSSYNNGVSESRTYNSDNTLASINYSGAPLGDLSYSWDANKNKTSESIDGVMSGYGFTAGYDAKDRLVSWERSDTSLDQSWDLSPVGNWNSITEDAAVQNRTHGLVHELLTAAGQSVEHDLKGNVTLLPSSLRPIACSLGWDFDNRLSAADTNNDGTPDVFYWFDAFGRRVARSASGSTTVYVQDGQQTFAEYASGASPSSPTYTYIWGDYIDDLVARDGSGGLRYYHRNQQYSIIAMTDSSGSITERYAYDAYGSVTFADASGTVRPASAESNRYTYTGREWDAELALYYFRARMYDPEAGRFIGRDPSGYLNGVSVYQNYIGLSLVDPTGKESLEIGGAAYWGVGGGGSLSISERAKPCCTDDGELIENGKKFIDIEVSAEAGIGIGGHFGVRFSKFRIGGSLEIVPAKLVVRHKATVENATCGEFDFGCVTGSHSTSIQKNYEISVGLSGVAGVTLEASAKINLTAEVLMEYRWCYGSGGFVTTKVCGGLTATATATADINWTIWNPDPLTRTVNLLEDKPEVAYTCIELGTFTF